MTQYPVLPGFKQPSVEVLAELFPFGEHGPYFGSVVQQLSKEIAQVPQQAEGQRFRWLKSDYEAFSSAMLVEGHRRRVRVADELPVERAREVEASLLGAFVVYHGALPFDDNERQWLYERYRELPRPYDAWRQRARVLQKMSEDTKSGDAQELFSGRDLAKRWWLWRRDAGEFAANDDRERARKGLDEAAEMLFPPERESRIAFGGDIAYARRGAEGRT